MRRVLCKSCGHVKRERLDFLADNPSMPSALPTTLGGAVVRPPSRTLPRNSGFTGRRSKTLEKQYIGRELARVGAPGPKAIGIDEVPIRKGHTYRIWCDLIRGRPIWFGGEDRKEGEHGAVLRLARARRGPGAFAWR